MLDNKYTKWYYRIVTNAKIRNHAGYIERHHIIPKSLGGSDNIDNIVNLTAKEHFVCHLLLTKMYSGKEKSKMQYAVWAMATLENGNQDRYKISSRLYEILRQDYAQLISQQLRGKKGKLHTNETKRKLSEIKKGKSNVPMKEESKKKLSNSMKGKNSGKKRTIEQKIAMSKATKGIKKGPLKEETKQKISKSLSGKKIKPFTDEHKCKISEALTGKQRSKEHSQKLSNALRGRTPSSEERKAYLKAMEEGKTTCVYCGKTTTKGNYVRWHGAKCKFFTGEKPI